MEKQAAGAACFFYTETPIVIDETGRSG